MEPPFVQPAPANPADAPTALSTEQARSWPAHRYTLVNGLFPTPLFDELQASAGAHFPEPDSEQAAAIRDFGSAANFPSRLTGFDELTLHPPIPDY